MKSENSFFLGMLKMLLMAFAIAFLVSILSNTFVGFTYWLSKAVGLLSPAVEAIQEFCSNCAEALG
jgi:hypothetical protein